MQRIGFVGLGHMGLPMALNLIKKGYHVSGYDLMHTAVEKLCEAGGVEAKSLAEVADNQDIVITMLQTGAQVKEVCLAKEGLFSHLKKGAIFIDCSSIDVISARELHLLAATAGILMLDAPVSGGVVGALAGTLTFMVGGPGDIFERIQPFLSLMGKNIIHTGAAGNGQVAKVCNNMLLAISMIGVSEAFILAQQLGLDPKKFLEVLQNASGHCWVVDHYIPVPNLVENVPANHAYQPGFTAAMMLKDLRLSQEAAEGAEVFTPPWLSRAEHLSTIT